MRHYLSVGAGALLVSLFFYGANIQASKADTVEFFKCSLSDGATMEELVAATEGFLLTAEENGHGDYSVRFMTPLYASDIARGVFYWVGVAPTFAAMGALNDYWDSDANKEHRDRWRELSSDCVTSSLYDITRVGPEE